MKKDKEIAFFDKPGNVKIFLRVFYSSLGLLLIVDFFIHKHAEFPWEEAPDFFAAYGFLSCVSLIFIAKALRMIVKRKESYYDESSSAEKPASSSLKQGQ